MAFHVEVVLPDLLPTFRVVARQHAASGDREDELAVAEWAGHVRDIVLIGPGHVGLGHVAASVRPDGQQLLRRAGHNDQSSGEHRRRRDFAVEPFHAPKFCAVLRGVGDHPREGEHNDLRLPGSLDDDRRGPGAPHLARTLPDNPTRAAIQRVEFRFALFRLALVELHDQPVLPGRQRRGGAIGVLQGAEALGPDRFPLQRKSRAVAIREDHIYPPAIRRHGWGGVASRIGDLRCRGTARNICHGLPPKRLTRLGAQAKDLAQRGIAAGEEDTVAPYDRRAKTVGGRGDLPSDAFAGLRVPRHGRIGKDRHTASIRAAEPRPVAFELLG